jgi:hypothetical protein
MLKFNCGKRRCDVSPNFPDFRMATPSDIQPSIQLLVQAAKLAIQQDKPIQLDYYVDTATGKAFMGEDQETKEKMLVKSNDEFTSLIQKVYKVANEYIVITENSIYLVSGEIQKRRIQAPALRDS